MPMHFSQSAGLENHLHRGESGLNREIFLLDNVLHAAFKHMRRLHVETIFVGELASLAAGEPKLFKDSLGDLARAYINFLFRKLGENRRRKIQYAASDFGRRISDPISDAERTEFREVSIVEAEQKMGFTGAQALQQMAVAAREIPGVAGSELIDGGLPVGHHNSSADPPFNHVGPFGGKRMPVKLPNGSWFEAHRHAGDALGNRELRNGGFVSGASLTFPVGLRFDIELEARDGGGLFLGVCMLRGQERGGGSEGGGLEQASAGETFGHI